MHRDLYKKLVDWKTDVQRMPLILRGARQVGKSWLVNEFGKSFAAFFEINFDEHDELCNIFNSGLSLTLILERISLYFGKKIIKGDTLIFLDEIQECPRALKQLRYFKEKHPELHVIAAGSLLDFLLDELGVPVGRVQFLFLYPLSFGEFLDALGRADLREFILSFSQDQTIHHLLLELLKTYMWLGGLPAIVHSWIQFRDAEKCQFLQDQIITAYQQDFLKYATKRQVPHLERVLLSIPQQLSNKFKFSHVDQEVRSDSLKTALFLLIKAGIAHPCYHTPGQGLPLGANINEKKIKVFFFDIGIAQRFLGLNLRDWVTMPIDVKYLGAIAEQLVAQEYIAYSSSSKPAHLYYWHREDIGSNAEVDFLFVKEGLIIPVEVKSGLKGGLKSLHSFLNSHPNSPYGLKISQNMAKNNEKLEEVPLYQLEGWMGQQH